MSSLTFDPHKLEEDTFGQTRENAGKRKRRVDGSKAVDKSLKLLQNGLSDNGFIKKKAMPATLESLKAIRDLADEKIRELEK